MADYNMGPYKPNFKDKFDPAKPYKFFDVVNYDGSSYICIAKDTIDGISCIGILPTGQEESSTYWMLYASKGDTGEAAQAYLGFKKVDADGIWDFSETDKVIVPADLAVRLSIKNAYDGCCGILITSNPSLSLPENSDYSIDFNYVTILSNQYYMYTFVCVDFNGGARFIWNRTVISRG